MPATCGSMRSEPDLDSNGSNQLAHGPSRSGLMTFSLEPALFLDTS
jgi:hypothetical protein